jgi:hypothetical protein
MPFAASAVLSVVVAIIAVAEAATAQSPDPDAFVHRLAGEWSLVTHTVLGPDQEPVRSEGQENARMVGSWLVAESAGDAGGRPFTGILTLGWNPHRERFVATWIDGVQRHLWQYTGALDQAGSILTLETEGPFMGDPSQTARYRILIEAPAQDRKVMRSQILGPSGEWFEFSRSEYHRLK